MGEEALAIARPGWLPTGSADACFLPATGSPVRTVRLLSGPAPLVSLPVLGARGGTGLRGLDSLGLLVIVLNFDGLVGYLGIAKALQIGGSPGSGCTQALVYCLCDFLLSVSHRRR